MVASGLEKRFLAPLSIKKIPMVGDKTFKTFSLLGVNTVSLVQEMPVERMVWERCNGIDDSPVIPFY